MIMCSVFPLVFVLLALKKSSCPCCEVKEREIHMKWANFSVLLRPKPLELTPNSSKGSINLSEHEWYLTTSGPSEEKRDQRETQPSPLKALVLARRLIDRRVGGSSVLSGRIRALTLYTGLPLNVVWVTGSHSAPVFRVVMIGWLEANLKTSCKEGHYNQGKLNTWCADFV